MSFSSQWPNAMFRIPELLEWVVVAHEPKVIEEIQKASVNVLSSADAFSEVSSFRPSLRL